MDTTHSSEREEGQPPVLDTQHRVPSPRLQLPTPPSPHPHKRHKKNGWNAPDYVPAFLPPFPKPANDEDVDPLELESALPSRAQSAQPELAPTVKVENLPLPLPPPTAAMSSSTDYTELNPIPYSQSSLGSLQEWHLPSAVRISVVFCVNNSSTFFSPPIPTSTRRLQWMAAPQTGRSYLVTRIS